MTQKISVQGIAITILKSNDVEFISLTDMLKAKDGDFFISDWLRNRNTVEFLGIWERVHNPNFNYGEFAIIKSQVGLHQGIKQSERLTQLNETAITQLKSLVANKNIKLLK